MPPELVLDKNTPLSELSISGDWQQLLNTWVEQQLNQGRENVLESALPSFEAVLIKAALIHSRGRKQEAAKLLGWGRNTLTRKLKELDIKS